MKAKAKKSMLLALVALFALSTPVFAQPVKELPWYFPHGITPQPGDPFQMKNYLRYLASEWNCFQGNAHGLTWLIPGNDSLRFAFDGMGGREKLVSTSSFTKSPADFTVVLDHYVRTGPDEITITTLCGQKVINNHQLQIVLDDFVGYAKRARDENAARWRDIEPKAVERRAKKLGVDPDDFRKYLDEKVPGTDITYREYNRLPKPSKHSDFMARELHLGFSPEISGIFGVAWLNTGLVYINPQARVWDYMAGYPSVLEHEMVHANVNFEEWPFVAGFDAELVASWLFLLPENQLDFFFHGYMSFPREIAQDFFGLDFQEARRRIFKFDAAGAEIVDEAAWKDIFANVSIAQAEIFKAMHEGLIELYSDSLFYMAMNDFLGDDYTPFRIVMAANYDLTSLGGHQPTMAKLETDIEKIRGWARDALKELKGKKRDNPMSAMLEGVHLPLSFVAAYKRLNEREQQELRRYFERHPQELKDLASDLPRLQEFFKTFRQSHLREGGAR
ncbi:MAG: hypothetical protein HY434_01270 [Candidatus Liptonbacteria bacterium]|nr:hypothetical protein [Candidatus Liptonbacteria bacterium]